MPLSPYGVSKLFCEEIGRAFAEETGISFIALRIGYFQRGENQPGPHMKIGEWGQSMWLSNADMNHAVERAIEAENVPFAIVNLESDNPGMRWDLEHTRKTIGYEPKDGAPIILEAQNRADDEAARNLRVKPGHVAGREFHRGEGLVAFGPLQVVFRTGEGQRQMRDAIAALRERGLDLVPRRRSALPMTLTEHRAIAAAAIAGDSRRPITG